MITVVGIGAEGWPGLTPTARHTLEEAEAIVGSPRQLALIPEPLPAPEGVAGVGCAAERVVLPSPLMPNLPGLLDSLAGRRACFLASGDPMHHGIGSTLVRLLGADRVRVLPHVSSISLACARLGWPVESVEVVNLVGRPPATLRATLAPGRRVLALGATIATIRTLLRDAGYAPSPITVLADLGAPTESIHTPTRDDPAMPSTPASGDVATPRTAARDNAATPSTPASGDAATTSTAARGDVGMPSTPASGDAATTSTPARDDVGMPSTTASGDVATPLTAAGDGFPRDEGQGDAALQVIAVECVPGRGVEPLARVPGLPDDAYDSDGQLTKREVRAVSLSRLAPLPGALLWDVGAGAGSVAIEWMRTHPSCRAVAVEHRADRAERLRRNAETLGVPALRVVEGEAPDALDGLPTPDAVFVGGGATAPGMLDACWEALGPGGRLVVNAVTLESETLVAEWYGRLGGDLVRLSVERASPVGRFTAWRPAMPVTIWSVTKPAEEGP